MSTNRFEDRIVVVVGAARSIGRAAVLRLLDEGAQVLAIDSPNEPLHDLVEAAGAGARLTTHPIPLDDPRALLTMADWIQGEVDRVDVLVSFQMDFDFSSIEDCLIDDWERVVAVTLTGPLAAAKAVLPSMKRSSAGSIVLIGSIDGIRGNPHVSSYSAGKAGLRILTHVMSHEFARYGIRVNYVARCGTSEHEREQPDEARQNLIRATPLGRLGDPSETAAAVCFLASEDASFITGATLTVDGGRTTITHGTA